MKILELRFKNLNSLAGEWRIDFTHPEYESSGIFAIVGPTGSGKTTILDAICLALYGQTPRLGKITKNTNELMTRQTADCFAEVIFESLKGKFRCHWSQKRARKKADGELQQSEHEIAEADSGKILESKIKEVLEKVNECTGMNFEQFTRSILLAQGDFDAFLGAKHDDRAPILEQITGTGIYTEISKRVHERSTREKMQLTTLQDEHGSVQILSGEERKELDHITEKKCRDAVIHAGRKTSLEHAITLKKQINQLEEDLVLLNAAWNDLNNKKDESLPSLTSLKKARAAHEFEPDYARLQAKIQVKREIDAKIRHDKAMYNTGTQAFQELQTHMEQLAEEMQKHSADASLRENFGTISQIITEYRKIVQKFTTCKTNQQKALQLLAGAQKILDNKENHKKTLVANHAEAISVEEKLQQERFAILGDKEPAILYEKKIALATKIEQLTTLTATIIHSETLDREFEDLQRRSVHLSTEKMQMVTALEQNQRDIELKEKKLQELDEKQKNLLTIRDLDSERDRLAPGKPCPLCGSPNHPYVSDHLPRWDEIDKVREIYIGKLKDLRDGGSAIIKRSTQIDMEESQNLSEQTKNRKQFIINERAIATGTASIWSAIEGNNQKRRLELAIATHTAEFRECDKTLANIANLQKIIFNAAKQTRQIKTELDGVLEEINRENLKIIASKAEVNNLSAGIENLNREYQETWETVIQKIEPYGYREINSETIETIIQDLEQRRDGYLRNEIRRQALVSAGQEDSAQLKSLARQIEEQQYHSGVIYEEILLLKNTLKVKICAAGFASCQDFLASRIDRATLEALEQLEERLKAEEIQLSSICTEKQKQLNNLRAAEMSDHSLTELNELLAICVQDCECVQSEILEIRLKIDRHETQVHAQNELLKKITKQQAEYNRWEKLNQLIGSHDGKKFRLFAQGITFDLLISRANKHLQRLNNRYFLTRTENGPLDMSVVDTHQAGEIRSTKNLSGGESFIVSLALALGLSDMASNNVRVDSLFLDEGFGTLDNKSLDIALDALISLQRDGKLIGIISHVPALQERITTQIVVEKRPGGLSSLIAPGCTAKMS